MKTTKLKINDVIETIDLSTKVLRYGQIYSIENDDVFVSMYDISAINVYKKSMIRKIDDKEYSLHLSRCGY